LSFNHPNTTKGLDALLTSRAKENFIKLHPFALTSPQELMTAVALLVVRLAGNGLDSNRMGILGWFRLGRNGLKSLLGWLNLGSHFSSPSHELVSSVTSRASSSSSAAAYAYAKQSAGPLRRGVDHVEGAVKAVFVPVYDCVPLDLLKFLDRKGR